MNKIFLATLMIIAAPALAMNEDPDRQPDDIELDCESALSEHSRNQARDQSESTQSDHRIHINVQPAAVHIPEQNDSALRSIADKIGSIRWQQYTISFNTAIQTTAITCMLCSVGDKISNAIGGKKLECTCTCPKCPNIELPMMAPTPLMMMRNDTMNGTNSNNTLAHNATSYSNGTYTNNTTAFLAMINTMTKQKTD